MKIPKSLHITKNSVELIPWSVISLKTNFNIFGAEMSPYNLTLPSYWQWHLNYFNKSIQPYVENLATIL